MMRLSTGKTTPDLFRDMHSITALVAPEITQEPYLLMQSDLPGLPEPIETGAYASARPCAATVQALRDAGLWTGPAPTIVFVNRLDDRLRAYGQFCHEVCHLVPFVPAVEEPAGSTELDAARSRYVAWAATGNRETAQLPRWAPYHGRDFLRLCCHVWYRALRLCCLDIPPRYVLHHEYDLSPLGSYIDALTPELRTTDPITPFADVVALPLPDAFQSLFDQDKARWLAGHEEST